MKTEIVSILAAGVLIGSQAGAATYFSDELAFLNAAGLQTLIEFETDGFGNPISNAVQIDDEYANLGVTFSSSNAGVPITNYFSVGLPVVGNGSYSGNNFIQLVSRTQGGGDLMLSFDAPIYSFSAWLGDFEPSTGSTILTIDYANGVDALVGVGDVAIPSPLAFSFFGAVFENPVNSLNIQIATGDYLIFDDISFSGVTSPVPLPATGALLAGAVGAGLSLSKRRSNRSRGRA